MQPTVESPSPVYRPVPSPSSAGLALLGLLLALPTAASAQSRTFSAQRASAIQFVSDAPLERMTGRSGALSGQISLDPSNLSNVSGEFSVPVRSLRTGIDLRDEHLRSDSWLDAERNPNITLEISSMEGASSLPANEPTQVRLRGSFTIHGVSRPVTINATVRWIPDENELRAQARFTVRLTDHDISVPAPVRLKVANEIAVNVRLVAAAG
jgi:polyisoprenoid-binding protein YceI